MIGDDIGKNDEPFKVEEEDIDYNSINQNQCPIELKGKYRGANCLNFEGCFTKEFEKEGIDDSIPTFMLFYSIFLSFVFYLLLIASILAYPSKDLIVYTILIYIPATFFQTRTFLFLTKIKTYSDFKKILEKLLNCKAEIWIKTNSNKNKIRILSNYTTDISGIINIPDNIKYVTFGKIQVFTDKEIIEIKRKFFAVNNEQNIQIKYFYKNEEVKVPLEDIYSLSIIDEYLLKSILKTILSLLQLLWVYNIIRYFIKKDKVLVIRLAKLVTEKQEMPSSPTKFMIHGKEFYMNKNTIINSEIDPNDIGKLEKLDKDYKKHLVLVEKKRKKKEEKKKKEKEEREKKEKEDEERRLKELNEEKEREERRRKREQDIIDNTKRLSRLDNEHFKITVDKVYDRVKLYITIYRKIKQNIHIERDIGEYDENAKENINNKEGNSIIFYPNGINVKIEIQFHPYNFTINVGTQFFQRFDLENEDEDED